MKIWMPWARYTGTKTNEPFERHKTFKSACAYAERRMAEPNSCFDHWGIDVFDSSKDEYTRHWWEFVNGQWEYFYKGQGIESVTA